MRKDKIEDRQVGQLGTTGTISSKLEARVRAEVQLVAKISIVVEIRKREHIRPKDWRKPREE